MSDRGGQEGGQTGPVLSRRGFLRAAAGGVGGGIAAQRMLRTLWGLNWPQVGAAIEKKVEGAEEVTEAAVVNPEGLMFPVVDMGGIDDFDLSVSATQIYPLRVTIESAADVYGAETPEWMARRGSAVMEVDGEKYIPGYFRAVLPNMRIDFDLHHTELAGGVQLDTSVEARWNRDYPVESERVLALLREGLEKGDRPILSGSVWNVQPVTPTEFRIRAMEWMLRQEAPRQPDVKTLELGVKLNTKTAGLPRQFLLDGQPYQVSDSSGVPISSSIGLPYVGGVEALIPATAYLAKHIYANVGRGEPLPILSFYSLQRWVSWNEGRKSYIAKFLWPATKKSEQVMQGLVGLMLNRGTVRDKRVEGWLEVMSRESMALGVLRSHRMDESVSAEEMLRLKSGDEVMRLMWGRIGLEES